jgi:hypothetical protein
MYDGISINFHLLAVAGFLARDISPFLLSMRSSSLKYKNAQKMCSSIQEECVVAWTPKTHVSVTAESLSGFNPRAHSEPSAFSTPLAFSMFISDQFKAVSIWSVLPFNVGHDSFRAWSPSLCTAVSLHTGVSVDRSLGRETIAKESGTS